MACTALPLLDTCTRFTPEWREATGVGECGEGEEEKSTKEHEYLGK